MIEPQIIFSSEKIKVLKESVKDYDLHTTSHIKPEEIKNNFIKDTRYGTYLEHYGVKGMKWGVRRYQNYDGTRIKKPESYYRENDHVVKKGHKFKRVIRVGKSLDKDDYKNKRLYVSDNEQEYLNDYFTDDPFTTRVMTFRANKKMLFAGEQAINKILKANGDPPLHEVYTKDGHRNMDNSGTRRDFLMTDNDISRRFIESFKNTPYSGVRDPVDDMDIGFSDSAKIILKYKDVSLESIDKPIW